MRDNPNEMFPIVDEDGNILVYVHRCIYDGEIRPSKDELSGGRFWTPQEIADNIGRGVFTPNFESEYQRFFD